MAGTITHTFKSVTTGNDMLILDTSDLTIKDVKDVQTGKSLKWKVYPFSYITNANNQQLVISLEKKPEYNEIFKIEIAYHTSPNSTAVSWVPEGQTFGGKYKFMYTQCEPNYCRSIAPLQDSPGIKSTFNAILRVKAPYVAIASALPTGQREEGDLKIYEYAQKIPVPSYLLALVAGNIVFKSAGKRAGVYAEPEIVDNATEEFSDMDNFMNTVLLYTSAF